MSRLPDLGPRGEGWVVIQLLLLGAIGLAGLLDPFAFDPTPAGIWVAGVVCLAGGGLLLGRGLLDLGRNLTPMPHPRDGAQLVVSGIYARVRHPIYGGVGLVAIGWGVVTGSPLAVLLATGLLIFFRLKSEREEDWLLEHYPGYQAYRERTTRFLPSLRRTR